MIALVVAFGSSSLRQSKEEELLSIRRQMEKLQRDNRTLQEKIRWVEGRYDQTVTLGKRLNQALLEEQKNSRSLAERLRRYSERTVPPDAGSRR